MLVETICSTQYLDLRIHDGWYIFASEACRCVVYVLGYRRNGDEILGRYENCPIHGMSGSIDMTSLTGKCDWHEEPIEAAQRELHEESGFEVDCSDMILLGHAYVSKAMGTKAMMYAVDLTGAPRGIAEGDGTRGEQGAYCAWVSRRVAILESQCISVAAMIQRAQLLGLIN